jgi:hypothetical protein
MLIALLAVLGVDLIVLVALKRLGERLTLIRVRAGEATVEIATAGEDAGLLLRSYQQNASMTTRGI